MAYLLYGDVMSVRLYGVVGSKRNSEQNVPFVVSGIVPYISVSYD